MRISFLLSIVPLITFALGLPVPGVDVSSLEERDLPLLDGRSVEPVHVSDRERRDSSGPPLDFDSRSGETLAPEQSLFKKDSGEHLEPRVVGAVIKVAKLAVEGIMAIVNHVKAKIEQEKEMRNTWTQWLITNVKAKLGPHWNALIIHPKHTYKFAGVQGKDWYHKHLDFKNSVLPGTTTGYDLYWFKEGEVLSKGDGGFLNWCYMGLVKSKQILGPRRTVVKFGRP
ncbi:hypothetical protein FA13DRAFT_1085284 [Coprinellus micaceus]|uniref:Uncharacterized protein n=1 Tax=Coprinellus micaceus TaxID=71717 RepID=A0A4Y7SE93_COPMI|nr:hypothetical protein FA13DRAFT_280346 [Coprinellus micaceus]TEB36798.1 hypothetical protein FA13DRAFT_1085284 [Coprinellus micaceus]